VVKIGALTREISVLALLEGELPPEARILGSFATRKLCFLPPYVEEPTADFSCEGAEIRGRSSDLVRYPG
jgi:hypothetical protein